MADYGEGFVDEGIGHCFISPEGALHVDTGDCLEVKGGMSLLPPEL